MSRLSIVLCIIVIIVTGTYRLLVGRKLLAEKEQFSIEYLTKLRQYLDSRGRDVDAYGWLIHQSVKMQSYIGQLGVMNFKPPASTYNIKNYQLILNGVPALKRAFEEDQFFTTISLANEYGSWLIESIIRYHGVLEESLKDFSKQLRNPFILFREGVQTILSLPLYILDWLGLGGNVILNSRMGTHFIRFLTGIISIMTFVSAVVSLVVGWDSFLTIIKNNSYFY